ncbi:MAG: transcriptional repressor, partial [Nitrospinae bacterium]|nr:transcriptional repressor [Nitrospinota bacterium]
MKTSNTLSRKYSMQREVILNILRSTKSHPTADWVYEQARRLIPGISLGTVYRNLKILKEDGTISELSFANTFCRYDGNAEPHYHFTCEKCKRV